MKILQKVPGTIMFTASPALHITIVYGWTCYRKIYTIFLHQSVDNVFCNIYGNPYPFVVEKPQ